MPVAVDRHSVRAATVSAVDRAFAEPVRFVFYDGYRPDPDRPMHDFRAILRVGGVDETTLAGGKTEQWRTLIAAGKAELTIDLASYEGPKPREGDRLIAVDRRFEPVFLVDGEPDLRGETRMIVKLNKAAA